MAITRLNNNSVTSVSALPNLASLPSGIPTGKVLQVVQGTYDTNSETINTNTFTQLGPTLSITPSSTSSKIFVQCHGGSMYTASDKNIKWGIYRNSTNLGNTNGFYSHFFNTSYGMSGVSMSYLDSPNSTSSLTYATYVRTSSGPATIQSNDTRMVLTAMEIAS